MKKFFVTILLFLFVSAGGLSADATSRVTRNEITFKNSYIPDENFKKNVGDLPKTNAILEYKYIILGELLILIEIIYIIKKRENKL